MEFDEVKLRDFVAWVRYRQPAGLPLDHETLEYVADGIDRLVNGASNPWPKPRGNKEKRDRYWECHWLCNFSSEYPDLYSSRRHKEPGGIYDVVGKRLNLSPSTVESHAKKGMRLCNTKEGQIEFSLWLANYKNVPMVKFIPSTAGEKHPTESE